MASGGFAADPEEDETYFCYDLLYLLMIKEGTAILKAMFDHYVPPNYLHAKLQERKVHKIITYGKNNKIIRLSQYRLLYPLRGPPSSEKFGISLLVYLLRRICGMTQSKWWKENDNSKIPNTVIDEEADIVRLRNIINKMRHTDVAAMEQTDFETMWDLAEQAMLRLALKCNIPDEKKKIAELKVMRLLYATEEMRSITVPDEIIYDPYKLYLYRKAIRTGKEKENRQRINVIGNFAQGKTSLTRSLIGQSIEGVTSTNGIDIKRYKCQKFKSGALEVTEDDEKDINFVNRVASVARSMDTERIVEIVRAEELNKPLIVSFPPVTPREILSSNGNDEEKQEVLVEDKDQAHEISPEIKTAKSAISTDEFIAFSNQIETEMEEKDISFDIWDFGGQFIFYATHTMFHSRKALYLLVVDLSSPLDKVVIDKEFPAESCERSMEYYIKFWIESIHSFVGPEPRVILVGTHKDILQDATTATQYFEQVRGLFEDTDMLDLILPKDFAVDNKNISDTEIPKLLQYILQIGNQLLKTVEVPARWIQLEKCLKNQKHKKVISFKDVMTIAAGIEYPLYGEEQVKLFLHYHHEKGSLFYFDEEPMSEHVVLEPRFLVDAFKCIITPEQFRLNNPSVRTLWRRLKTQGILTEELINKVWSNRSYEFMDHKMVLLGYLKKHNIISQVVEYDEKGNYYKEHNWYVVPSLLKECSSSEDMSGFLKGKSETQIRYCMRFEKSCIVQISYQRLLCAALGRWPVLKFASKQMLFKDLAVFQLEKSHAGLIELKYPGVELRTVNLCANPIDCQISESFRRFVESVIRHEFRKLNYNPDDKQRPFHPEYRCNHKIHGVNGSTETNKIDILEQDNAILCPDNYSHDLFSSRKAKAEWLQDESKVETFFPKKKLTEKHLSRLAGRAIGKNWQLLGIELDLNQVTIDHISEENQTVAMRIFRMLLQWKDKSADNATLDVLVQKMKHCKSVEIDWDELRNIKDEHTGLSGIWTTGFRQPLTDKVVEENRTLVLECETTQPDVKVKWLKDGQEVNYENRVKTNTREYVHQLIVENATSTDGGLYECVFESAGTKCSIKIVGKQTPLGFIEQLSDICVPQTSCTAVFQCKLNMTIEDVHWYHDNHAILCSEKYQFVNEGPLRRLQIRNVVEKDEGRYRVSAEGHTSSAWLYLEDTHEERELIRQHVRTRIKAGSVRGANDGANERGSSSADV